MKEIDEVELLVAQLLDNVPENKRRLYLVGLAVSLGGNALVRTEPTGRAKVLSVIQEGMWSMVEMAESGVEENENN